MTPVSWSSWALGLLALAGLQSPASAPSARSAPPPGPGHIVYPRGVALPVAGGAVRVSSMLSVPAAMRFGEYVWREPARPAGETWVRVDLGRQVLSVFRGGDEVGTAVVLFGADGRETPRGSFRVLERDRDHVSSTYGAPMPFMLRLTADGVAIHASDVRQGRATHGCVGVPPAFAERLYGAARRGMRVYVV